MKNVYKLFKAVLIVMVVVAGGVIYFLTEMNRLQDSLNATIENQKSLLEKYEKFREGFTTESKDFYKMTTKYIYDVDYVITRIGYFETLDGAIKQDAINREKRYYGLVSIEKVERIRYKSDWHEEPGPVSFTIQTGVSE